MLMMPSSFDNDYYNEFADQNHGETIDNVDDAKTYSSHHLRLVNFLHWHGNLIIGDPILNLSSFALMIQKIGLWQGRNILKSTFFRVWKLKLQQGELCKLLNIL